MSVLSNRYIIQNIEAVSAYDLSDGSLLFRADDLKSATMTNEQETVYATGKNGVKIGASDRNKASRFTAENGSIVDGVISAQVGSAITTGTYIVPNFTEVLAVTASGSNLVATTTYVASGTTGTEIKYIYKKNADGTAGAKFPIAATASATAFAYNPSTKVITCPTSGFAAGNDIIAIYDIQVSNAKKIENKEDAYSSTVKAVFDIFCQDICTNKSYFGTIVYPKGKVSGNFELAFGDDPSVQSLEIEALSGGCSGSSKVLWDFYIYDEEDIDD